MKKLQTSVLADGRNLLTEKSRPLPLVGVLGVVLLWSGTIIGMRNAGLGLVDTRPLSYLGVATGNEALFTASLLFSSMYFSLFGYFIYRRLKLSRKFLIVYLIGQLGQAIAAVAPYGGSSKLVHTVAAFVLAYSIPVHMIFFVKSLKKSTLRTVSKRLVYLELVCFIIGIGTFMFIEGVSPLAEILPAIPFHIWIIYVTYNLRKTHEI